MTERVIGMLQMNQQHNKKNLLSCLNMLKIIPFFALLFK